MSDTPWEPTASLDTLKKRADILSRIRAFFAGRGVLEVETPLLARYSVTDPHMDVISADHPCGAGERYFLQTSPEYAMKRLLAAGSGPIYQLGKAFRKGERGSRHNPEFTMLEWYRPGFSLCDLMDEIEALLRVVLGAGVTAQRIEYRKLFLDFLGFDPLLADCNLVERVAREHVDVQMRSDSVDDWLNLLMAEVVEPKLASMGPVFVCDYPASQAALARVEVDEDGTFVARRFELYVDGMELANGYHELTDAAEQRRRFELDNEQRREMGRDVRDLDEFLLAAVESGLPICSGVALGFDRLVMLALKKKNIAEVLAFSSDRA